MKICSYIMTSDTGFAPNPFYGYCTLAACTPNHMHALLDKGDYIAGFFTDQADPYLVYWLKVDEVLDYDEYFHDSRFKRKKPILSGTWLSRCGDNIYCLDESGKWVQKDTLYHKEKDLFDKDTRYAVVYIGRDFSYFGANAYSRNNFLPQNCRDALKKGKGIKYTHKETHPYYKIYFSWLNSKSLGRHGNPRDRGKKGKCSVKKQQNNSIDCRTSQCT